jgi:hypothetical protein
MRTSHDHELVNDELKKEYRGPENFQALTQFAILLLPIASPLPERDDQFFKPTRTQRFPTRSPTPLSLSCCSYAVVRRDEPSENRYRRALTSRRRRKDAWNADY